MQNKSRKKKNEVRDRIITIKCSDAEKWRIKVEAEDAELSVSSYCLNRILRRRTGIRDRHDREIITQAIKTITALNELDEKLEKKGIEDVTNNIRREVESLWGICRK